MADNFEVAVRAVAAGAVTLAVTIVHPDVGALVNPGSPSFWLQEAVGFGPPGRLIETAIDFERAQDVEWVAANAWRHVADVELVSLENYPAGEAGNVGATGVYAVRFAAGARVLVTPGSVWRTASYEMDDVDFLAGGDDRGAWLRRLAALGHLDAGAAGPNDAERATLLDALRVYDASVRRAAAEQLERMGARAAFAVRALGRLAARRDVAQASAWCALGATGDARAAGPLAIALGRANDDREVALAAVALGRLGPAARVAAPALERCARHWRGDLRVASRWAQWRIGGRPEDWAQCRAELRAAGADGLALAAFESFGADEMSEALPDAEAGGGDVVELLAALGRHPSLAPFAEGALRARLAAAAPGSTLR
jgi:hypothetical protein